MSLSYCPLRHRLIDGQYICYCNVYKSFRLCYIRRCSHSHCSPFCSAGHHDPVSAIRGIFSEQRVSDIFLTVSR
jgi:hypothetical protein